MSASQSAWDVLASAATVGAAIMAAMQLMWSRHDSNKRLTISLIQQFSEKLDFLNTQVVSEVRHDILSSYHDRTKLSSEGGQFLSFVHSIEVIAHGYFEGSLDKSMIDHFLKGILADQETISVDFLRSLQDAQGSSEAYSSTIMLIQSYNALITPGPSSSERRHKMRRAISRWLRSVSRSH